MSNKVELLSQEEIDTLLNGVDADEVKMAADAQAAVAVIELDCLLGEILSVLVGGDLIAQGELVVVNEKLGIRLSDDTSVIGRVKKLQ